MNLTVEESEFIPCDVFDTTRVLKRRNPQAAVRFVEPFAGSIKLLSTMPAIGVARGDLGAPETRSWRIKGFRNYLIFYEVTADRLRLLRVLHGHRDLQAELNK